MSHMFQDQLLNQVNKVSTMQHVLIILDSKSSVCMSKDGNYTNHTRHISIRAHFLINGEKCKMCRIDWCEGGLKLADIATRMLGLII